MKNIKAKFDHHLFTSGNPTMQKISIPLWGEIILNSGVARLTPRMHSHYLRGDPETIIVKAKFPFRYWYMDKNEKRWSYTINKFLAAILNRSKDECLLTLFRWGSYKPEFAIYVNPPNSEPLADRIDSFCFDIKVRKRDHQFWDSSDFYMSHYTPIFQRCSASAISYIFTDYIFVELEAEAVDRIGSFSLALDIWDISGVIGQICLDGRTAAIVTTSKQSTLFAFKWQSQQLPSRETVLDYCQNIFNWCERRHHDPFFMDPCPASVMLGRDNRDYMCLEPSGTRWFKFENDSIMTLYFLGRYGVSNPSDKFASYFDGGPCQNLSKFFT
jgi:hypothetical protein